MGIENNDPSIMDKLFIEFAAMATAFFTFRDLIFERGANGISIILPNIDLDHGFRMAEEFRHKIATRSSTPDFAKIDLRIGLSSRSGRLVDPDRLLAEADRALEKARDDPASPIVAFKSDPERYRRFLAAQA
jgi:GGDEF domain-containing protein